MDQIQELLKQIEDLKARVETLERERVDRLHTHNGSDTSKIKVADASDVNFIGNMGVATNAKDSIDVNGPQTFDGGTVSYPIPIIVGHGVGGAGAFAFGAAPNGTMLLFTNGATLSGLQIMFDGQWYRIAIDSIT